MKGLAYVDFSDDAHLAAALQKNKQIFMGKKLSILKSDPKQGRKKEVAGRSGRAEHGKLIHQHVYHQILILPCVCQLLFETNLKCQLLFEVEDIPSDAR